jgi:transposase
MNTIPWNQRSHFGGLDWARDHHDLVVVDKDGALVCEHHLEHTVQGWQALGESLRTFQPLPVAVETNQGIAVEQLLALGCEVYPVNPKSARRYRERKAPTGVKDDRRDAWSLADALRVDGHGWKALRPEDPLMVELRLLTRDEVALIAQRTALINQLQSALRDYYPAALSAFDDWTCPSSWAFLEAFPTPRKLVQAGPRRWQKFLHTQHLWQADSGRRMDVFAQADGLHVSEATVAAKSFLVLALVRVLRPLQGQLQAYRERIEQLFARHPDHDLFGSLPGAGNKLAPRLLAELGDQRDRFDSAEGLQAYAGTAPVTFQSGRIRRHYLRRACTPHLRTCLFLWAEQSRRRCAWAQAYYRAHRQRGQNHATALRCLGQRWLKILWRMWQDRTPYDEALHIRNQVRHGSWVLQLTAEKPA